MKRLPLAKKFEFFVLAYVMENDNWYISSDSQHTLKDNTQLLVTWT